MPKREREGRKDEDDDDDDDATAEKLTMGEMRMRKTESLW